MVKPGQYDDYTVRGGGFRLQPKLRVKEDCLFFVYDSNIFLTLSLGGSLLLWWREWILKPEAGVYPQVPLLAHCHLGQHTSPLCALIPHLQVGIFIIVFSYRLLREFSELIGVSKALKLMPGTE